MKPQRVSDGSSTQSARAGLNSNPAPASRDSSLALNTDGVNVLAVPVVGTALVHSY